MENRQHVVNRLRAVMKNALDAAKFLDDNNIKGKSLEFEFDSFSLKFLRHKDMTHIQSVSEVFGNFNMEEFATLPGECAELAKTYLWMKRRGYSAKLKIPCTFGKYFFDGILLMLFKIYLRHRVLAFAQTEM